MRGDQHAAGVVGFGGDSWLDWEPDPRRASRDAVPGLEPYASLTKRELVDLMSRAEGGREWEFLQQYYLDLCREEELGQGPREFIRTQYGPLTRDEMLFLEDAVGLALRHRRAHGRHAGPLKDRSRALRTLAAGPGEDLMRAGWHARLAGD